MVGRWCAWCVVGVLGLGVSPAAVVLAAPPAVASPAADPAVVPASVAAWGGISSWNAVFDVVAAAGPQLGLLSPQQGAPGPAMWAKVEGAAKGIGITTLAWMRRDQPLRFFLQDEGGEPGVANLVVLLPMTDQAAVLAALPSAQLGIEGHAAVLAMAGSPAPIYLDFLPSQVALTFETSRWQRASAVATGPLATAPVPGLVAVGLSMANLLALGPKEMQKLRSVMDSSTKKFTELQAGASSYATAVKQLLEELDTFELVLGGDKERIQVGFRIRGRDGTALFKSLHAGDGRSAAEVARLLPGASYLAFASHVDPQPALAQAATNFELLQPALEVPKKQKAALLAQYTALIKGLTGEGAVALYPDGGAALGSLVVLGAKEPAAFRQASARFAGQVALLLMDKQDRKALAKGKKSNASVKGKKSDASVKGKKGEPGAAGESAAGLSKAQLEALARKGLARGTLEPLITALAPKAEAAGVRLAQTHSNADGLACDAIEITLDWAKLQRESADQTPMGQALLGKSLTLAACSTPRYVVFATGNTALAHARRVAANEPGGLADQPGYRAALAHAVPSPSSLFLADALLAFQTFQAFLADPELKAQWKEALGAALPMSFSMGAQASAAEYRLDLPLSFLAAMKRAFKLIAEGKAQPEAAAEVPADGALEAAPSTP